MKLLCTVYAWLRLQYHKLLRTYYLLRVQKDQRGTPIVWVFKTAKYEIRSGQSFLTGEAGLYWHQVRSRLWGIFTDEKHCIEWCQSNFVDSEDGYYNIGILEPVKINSMPYCLDLETHFFYYSRKLRKIRKIKRPSEWAKTCGFTIG